MTLKMSKIIYSQRIFYINISNIQALPSPAFTKSVLVFSLKVECLPRVKAFFFGGGGFEVRTKLGDLKILMRLGLYIVKFFSVQSSSSKQGFTYFCV